MDNVKTKEAPVSTRINGSMRITFKDKILKYKEIKLKPVKQANKTLPAKRAKYTLSANHPWRKTNSSLYKEKAKIT